MNKTFRQHDWDHENRPERDTTGLRERFPFNTSFSQENPERNYTSTPEPAYLAEWQSIIGERRCALLQEVARRTENNDEGALSDGWVLTATIDPSSGRETRRQDLALLRTCGLIEQGEIRIGRSTRSAIRLSPAKASPSVAVLEYLAFHAEGILFFMRRNMAKLLALPMGSDSRVEQVESLHRMRMAYKTGAEADGSPYILSGAQISSGEALKAVHERFTASPVSLPSSLYTSPTIKYSPPIHDAVTPENDFSLPTHQPVMIPSLYPAVVERPFSEDLDDLTLDAWLPIITPAGRDLLLRLSRYELHGHPVRDGALPSVRALVRANLSGIPARSTLQRLFEMWEAIGLVTRETALDGSLAFRINRNRILPSIATMEYLAFDAPDWIRRRMSRILRSNPRELGQLGPIVQLMRQAYQMRLDPLPVIVQGNRMSDKRYPVPIPEPRLTTTSSYKEEWDDLFAEDDENPAANSSFEDGIKGATRSNAPTHHTPHTIHSLLRAQGSLLAHLSQGFIELSNVIATTTDPSVAASLARFIAGASAQMAALSAQTQQTLESIHPVSPSGTEQQDLPPGYNPASQFSRNVSSNSSSISAEVASFSAGENLGMAGSLGSDASTRELSAHRYAAQTSGTEVSDSSLTQGKAAVPSGSEPSDTAGSATEAEAAISNDNDIVYTLQRFIQRGERENDIDSAVTLAARFVAQVVGDRQWATFCEPLKPFLLQGRWNELAFILDQFQQTLQRGKVRNRAALLIHLLKQARDRSSNPQSRPEKSITKHVDGGETAYGFPTPQRQKHEASSRAARYGSSSSFDEAINRAKVGSIDEALNSWLGWTPKN